MRKEIRRRQIGRRVRRMCVGVCVVACSAGIGGCSGNGTNADSTADSAVQPDTDSAATQGKPTLVPEREVRDVTLFGVKTKPREGDAVRDLAAAGILKIEDIREENGEFKGAVVEFGGVKFGMNSGFMFITSRHDKKAIKGLIKAISKYYGEPEIEGEEEPQYNYYHWNLHKEDPDAPYIRIRPLHSEEGGMTMLWVPSVVSVEVLDAEQVNKYQEQVKEQVKEQVNLSEKQKEILNYLIDHPSASLKTCSDATGASAMSIRYTFKKVKSWLDIWHEGPDKTGIWSFKLVNKE